MRSLLTWERRDPEANVLIVTSGYPNELRVAYCPFLKREVEELNRQGVRCDVLLIRGFVSVLAYPLAALRFALWNLTSAPKRYSVVHAHSGEAALAAAFYRRAPLLVSYWGDDLLGTPDANGVVSLTGKFRRGLIRRHSALAHGTITMTKEMEDVLPARIRLRNVVVPDGVDPEVFRELDRHACRERLGWGEHERVALFAANPEVPRKRHWLAKAAVDLVRHTVSDAVLRVVTGVPPDELPVYMSAADCLILPSSHEGSPNVVKEAMMCNLPVVATAVGDVAELLEGVRPSAMASPTPEAFAVALIPILRHPRRSNGREHAVRVSASVVYERVVDYYRRLADGEIVARGAGGAVA